MIYFASTVLEKIIPTNLVIVAETLNTEKSAPNQRQQPLYFPNLTAIFADQLC
jgi:hypothetical protein